LEEKYTSKDPYKEKCKIERKFEFKLLIKNVTMQNEEYKIQSPDERLK